MDCKRIYLLHPTARNSPHISSWISQFRGSQLTVAPWEEWDLISISLNDYCGFSVNDVVSRVLESPGPLLCVEPIQRSALENLRDRLRSRCVVLVGQCFDAVTLAELLDQARQRDDLGEPFLPRKYVVALLIIRKYEKLNFWSGNAKGYGYADEIAKGRGVDETFSSVAREVASDMLQCGYLVTKPSRRRTKYALNPDQRVEIMGTLKTGIFPERLSKLLMKDTNEVSARLLD